MIVPILLMSMLTFAFIAYPFFRNRFVPLDTDPAEDDKLQELNSRKDTTYSMLKELEFDRQSGLLTEEDYKDLEARYKGKAISILKDIDGLAKDDDVEDAIEKEVMSLRRSKDRFCPQCGERRRNNDRFCSKCGTNLRPEASD